jgi:hypothetical protein
MFGPLTKRSTGKKLRFKSWWRAAASRFRIFALKESLIAHFVSTASHLYHRPWGCIRDAKVEKVSDALERDCCLLVLNSVTSTPQWIRQPKPRDVVHDLCVCLCVNVCSEILGLFSP